ncbi:nuclear transport factor 2 family protein [Foetidibacter luteolus]|uniref:nuclear transport factor 2 family protein n=1 Tax=Foetidibacter luteolus TaxID=2608880 RepID=UPI001A98E018|nr:nuclear transport factor 2 family protein [Foetidibacter luteolus]
MTPASLADKVALTELANKLFMYCDAKLWQRLLDEVFTESIWFDVSSGGGGEAKEMAAADVCKLWNEGFDGLDAAHHQAGHYLITVNEDSAIIYAYAVATHYKKAATQGHTRTFVGSYDLTAQRTPIGWRLNQFKYNLKYMDGNVTME